MSQNRNIMQRIAISDLFRNPDIGFMFYNGSCRWQCLGKMQIAGKNTVFPTLLYRNVLIHAIMNGRLPGCSTLTWIC